MKVTNIHVANGRSYCELRADITFETQWVWGERPFPLWYRFPGEYAEYLSPENGDPFVAALLPPAMFLGEVLSIEAPVSEKLLAAVPQIQSIYGCWEKDYSTTVIEAPIRRPQPSRESLAKRIGLFFSMGVDSSYTLCKNLQNRSQGSEGITHLIVVNGFDVYLWEEKRFPPLLNAVHRVAAELEKTALPVTTNLRDLSDRVVDWLRVYHGPALVSVALALGGAIGKAHISASQTYASLIPLGTHPLLDPLWGTEQISFVHDGLEADRMAKIRSLSLTPVLLANLRVCTTSAVTDAYNCGRCEKCLRTMIALHAAGLLHQCRTLPPEIDLELVRNIRIENSVARETLLALTNVLGESEENLAVRSALFECLERNDVYEGIVR